MPKREDELIKLITNWLFIQEKPDALSKPEIERLAFWIDTRLPEGM